jgi:isoamylase
METTMSADHAFAGYAASVSEIGSVRHGVPHPLGAQESAGGVNFSLFGRNAHRVQLELFARAEDDQPERLVELDPVRNRTGDVWHVWIEGIAPGQLYTYRVNGIRVLDPRAKAVKQHHTGGLRKCVVTRDVFDWRDDVRPRHSWSETVIYETHVRGLTEHPSAKVQSPGTFSALVQKIPYLRDLGITAVQVLPVQEFDSSHCAGSTLPNYWGYEPFGVFAPHGAGDSGQQTCEFKEMVRSLHAAGLEIILDIDFPHSRGPVGPTARQFVVDTLRYWVAEMHVDGFRLDLATLFGRDAAGKLLSNPHLLEEIAEDPVLRETKLIVAAWGSAGAYRVASFSEQRWSEWNTHYRDDVRRFWRGDLGAAGAFASRICGSEDLYAASGKGPEISINFVTCHDGLTLNDLITSEHDCDAEAARHRRIKNYLMTLFLSRGVPMLLGGDEFGRTQSGNDNAYCEDNEISWYDWSLLEKNADLHGFVKRMIELRRSHPVLSKEEFYTPADIRWLSARMTPPDWGDPNVRTLGCLIREPHAGALLVMFNAGDRSVSFRIPPAPPGLRWQLALSTTSDEPTGVRGVGAAHDLEPCSAAILTTAPLAGGACNVPLEACAKAMGGEDADVAYAAAMLWYQGYPW